MAKAPRAKAAAKAPAGRPTRAGAGRKALAAAQTAMEADPGPVATAKKRVLAAQVKARGSARKTDKNALVAARAALQKAGERFARLEGKLATAQAALRAAKAKAKVTAQKATIEARLVAANTAAQAKLAERLEKAVAPVPY